MKKFVLFTDLDGTLLDAENYSCAEAQPALDRIAENATPLVLCSSKTRSEIETLRKHIGNVHPFIAENGGGIFIPPGYFASPHDSEESHGYQLIRLGKPYDEIRNHFVRLREQLGARVRGFADMSVSEVAALTGLNEKDAALARQRDFDEAFIFEGETDENFLRAIETAGLNWTQGRIFHIMGRHDKGRALDILLSLYRKQYGEIESIALGDSLNDLAMLAGVDRPVLVMHRDGTYDARMTFPGLLKTRLPGPAGWNETVLQLFAYRDLLEIFHAALAAVDPYNAILRTVEVEHQRLHVSDAEYDLSSFERIIVIGAGKATARMAQAVESLIGNRISKGLIVIKDGHTAPLSIIEQVEASHPIPNEAGITGTHRMLEMARNADEKTLVICLLSGGASALMVAPAEGVSLRDKQEATRLLLNSGATINELNAVRKHLSSVKGGRLAQEAYPAQLLTLIVSDVIGDPLDVIASGPTSQDSSTYANALAVIEKYGLKDRMPASIMDSLQRGIKGESIETVKAGDPCQHNTRNVIIASNRQALNAAQEKSSQLGYATKTISDTLQGEAGDAARFLAEAARIELSRMAPAERRCLLCGGETTVTVRGNGKGGRNQEFALDFALHIEGCSGVSMLSAGTDGTDGPTDAAGALIDGNTMAHARSLGLDPSPFLASNDSYGFFQRFDELSGERCHLKTGPTGTNVMDLQIILLNNKS